ncbi:hypothetical protein ACH49_24740 [Streptomyces leeuwenhoekii]|uniref:Uncharacterized protein n=1 Tax=Streptomyces leeuwenhoekii TaxID=1437453 RepID=A0ABR5HSV2_STRLW|nr:hypothetical protein [Streptomyces leeuwenhoekii]KMS71307.1 hypothetical protein ACH49_24740 [Streptomyces leeuwenhoekii]
MIRYHNTNTGQVVEKDSEDARLESLSNWERLEGDETPEPAAPDSVLKRPQTAPGTALTSTEGPRASQEEEFKEQQEDAGDPPARSAPKDAWVEYAQARAVSDEERQEIPQLTKDMLIAKYGEGA